MNTLTQTDEFSEWLHRLKDPIGKARIASRLNSAVRGNFGDHKHVGCGVWEMRVDVGPGYRIYYAQEYKLVYVLLLGGDKSRQSADIEKAKRLWEAIKEASNG